jgi:hypothetical protein
MSPLESPKMRAFIPLVLVACGACSAEGASPLRAPDAPEPTWSAPGAQLRAAKLTNQGLIAPALWVDGADLRSVFPARPAVDLRESWFAGDASVCREATWDDDAQTVTAGAHALVLALVGQHRAWSLFETIERSCSNRT